MAENINNLLIVDELFRNYFAIKMSENKKHNFLEPKLLALCVQQPKTQKYSIYYDTKLGKAGNLDI